MEVWGEEIWANKCNTKNFESRIANTFYKTGKINYVKSSWKSSVFSNLQFEEKTTLQAWGWVKTGSPKPAHI